MTALVHDRDDGSFDGDEAFDAAVRHVVEKLITDDWTVLAPPLMWGRPNDPVWERLREVLREQPDGPTLDLDNWEALAHSLSVPVDLIQTYPVTGLVGVTSRVLDELDLPYTEASDTLTRIQAWLDRHARPDRQFRVQPVGREFEIETWLETNLAALQEFGFDVRLCNEQDDGIRGRQPRIATHHRADLLCRFTRDCAGGRRDDWLVIELKAAAVGQVACMQLAKYVDRLPARVGCHPTRVQGLLIADGSSVNLGRSLKERGLGYLSLTAMGYRDVLRGATGRVREADATAEQEPRALHTIAR